MIARRIAKSLMMLGFLVLAGATAWWYAFFEQMLGLDVKKASECFYITTDACSVGNVLGSVGKVVGVLGDIPAYSPIAFWSAVAVFAGGVLIYLMIRD